MLRFSVALSTGGAGILAVTPLAEDRFFLVVFRAVPFDMVGTLARVKFLIKRCSELSLFVPQPHGYEQAWKYGSRFPWSQGSTVPWNRGLKPDSDFPCRVASTKAISTPVHLSDAQDWFRIAKDDAQLLC